MGSPRDLGKLQASPLASPASSTRSLRPMGAPLPLGRQGSEESLGSGVSARSAASDRKEKKSKKEKKAKKDKWDASQDAQAHGHLGKLQASPLASPMGSLRDLGKLQASPLASPASSTRSLRPMGAPLPLGRQGSEESLGSAVSARSAASDWKEKKEKKSKKEKKAKKEKRDSDDARDSFLRVDGSIMRRGSSPDSLGS